MPEAIVVPGDASEEQRNSRDVMPTLADSEHFKQNVLETYALTFEALLQVANEKWPDIVDVVQNNDRLRELTIGPLTDLAQIPWPSTRRNESLGHFLSIGSPPQILQQAGFGKIKVRSLLTILLAVSQLSETVDLNTVAISGCCDGKVQIPSDPVVKVEKHWQRMCANICDSPIANEPVSSLARRWGIKWPTKNKVNYVLRDIVSAESLAKFVSRSRGIGRKKMPSIAEVIWRAWAEAEPYGPAGPPKSPEEVAEEEYEAVAGTHTLIEIVRKGLDLAGLDERELSIVERRYGIADGVPMTLEEVGHADRVTRERIRQIQQMAERTIVDHQVSRQFFELTLKNEIPEILGRLKRFGSTPLLRRDDDCRPALTSSHLFLIELIHQGIFQFLEVLAEEKLIQRTPSGWWMGNTLTSQSLLLQEWIQEQLAKADHRPLPLVVLAEKRGVTAQMVQDAALSCDMWVEKGYVFAHAPNASERRCVFALQVAAENGRYLWPELEFHRTAAAKNPAKSGALRLLLRDVDDIPGVAIDIPGPFVLINPLAIENLTVDSASDDRTTECEIFDEDQEGVEVSREQAGDNTIASQLE